MTLSQDVFLHSESTGAGDFVEEDDAQAERVPFDLAFMWWSSKKWWTEWFHAEQLLPPGPLFERIIWHIWLATDNPFHIESPEAFNFRATALEFKLPLAWWKWMMRMIISITYRHSNCLQIFCPCEMTGAVLSYYVFSKPESESHTVKLVVPTALNCGRSLKLI